MKKCYLRRGAVGWVGLKVGRGGMGGGAGKQNGNKSKCFAKFCISNDLWVV